ncbi:MAG: hypothetical protein KatS3mg027_0721 [Bacteroidia bacterium]|nr:MAG: hypothetical protein KatS3mg027_0721 [Bacteroidia bacterium]
MFLKFLNKLILIFIILTSCNNEREKTSVIFSNYLFETFSIKLPEDSAFFVLIPAGSCAGCYQYLIKIIEHLYFKHKENFWIIVDKSSYDYSTFKTLSPEIKVLIDNKNHLSRLNLNIQNTTLIKTFQQKIIDKRLLLPDE